MHQKPLGKVGFGVAGPHSARLFPAATTCALIEQAIVGGIRFFDTGPSYGGGEAERRLGHAILGHDRQNLVLSTKAGVNEQGQRDFSPSSIRQSLERSLERLGVGSVDVLFLHGPAATELTDELLDTLQDMQKQNMFQNLGLAGRGSELTACLTRKDFNFLMLPMGPETIAVHQPIARQAQDKGTKVIGIEMLMHTRNPWRMSLWPGDVWHLVRRLVRGGGEITKVKTAIALEQALGVLEVDTVLSSTTRHKHMKEWLACLDE